MEKLRMENRMVLSFQDMEAHWARDAYDVCERFLQTGAVMRDDDYIGFQIVADGTYGYEAVSFSGPDVRITLEDYRWIFSPCAEVRAFSGDPQMEFERKGQWIYVLNKDLSKQRYARADGRDKSFGKYFAAFLADMREERASLRVVAWQGKEDARGLLYFSLPHKMTLRTRAIVLTLFPGTEIREIPACSELIPEKQLLPFGQLRDSMMGILGLIKKIEEEKPENIEDDGMFSYDGDDDLFDPAWDETDQDGDLDENSQDESLDTATPDTPASETDNSDKTCDGPLSIDDLELSVRTYNCLKRANISTLTELRTMTDEELLKVRNLGYKGMCEIREKLNKRADLSEEALKRRQLAGCDHYRKLLDEMVGLDNVKAQVERIVCFAKMKQDLAARKKNCANLALNMEFVGNPGTAKTTVARILAGIFYESGLLSKPDILEVGRVDLIAGYVGQTAEKVQAVFEKARGRLLFIDEAYSLVEEGRNYCDEAISTLVQEMENHRDETIVIFAGYPDNMKEFFEMNPGLRSRVPFQISFADYSVDEMLRITEREADKRGFSIDPDAKEKVKELCREAAKDPKGGNGRFCRNLAENAILNYASRVYGKFDNGKTIDFVLLRNDFSHLGYISETGKERVSIGF